MTVATIMVSVPALGQTKVRVNPASPCCAIVSIDGLRGTATAKNTATGQLLTFTVTDKAVLQGLRVGQSIYFDTRTQKVALNYAEPCCDIVSQLRGGTTPAAPIDGALPPNDAVPVNAALSPNGAGPIDGIMSPAVPCCQLVSNPDLNTHLGRVVVNFPAGAEASAVVEVRTAGTNDKVAGWFDSGAADLGPGRYDITINNKTLRNVQVVPGQDTQVRVGTIRAKGNNLVINLLDADQKTKVGGAYGNLSMGVPAGTYFLQMPGLTQKVTVQAGKITDF